MSVNPGTTFEGEVEIHFKDEELKGWNTVETEV